MLLRRRREKWNSFLKEEKKKIFSGGERKKEERRTRLRRKEKRSRKEEDDGWGGYVYSVEIDNAYRVCIILIINHNNVYSICVISHAHVRQCHINCHITNLRLTHDLNRGLEITHSTCFIKLDKHTLCVMATLSFKKKLPATLLAFFYKRAKYGKKPRYTNF